MSKKWILGIVFSATLISAACSQREDQMTKAITFCEGFVEHAMRPALLRFKTDVGRFPLTNEGLEVLRFNQSELPGWGGPYVQHIPSDPWGNRFQYRSPGIHNPESYDLWSLGPDGLESSDDIGNWSDAN